MHRCLIMRSRTRTVVAGGPSQDKSKYKPHTICRHRRCSCETPTLKRPYDLNAKNGHLQLFIGPSMLQLVHGIPISFSVIRRRCYTCSLLCPFHATEFLRRAHVHAHRQQLGLAVCLAFWQTGKNVTPLDATTASGLRFDDCISMQSLYQKL